MLYKRDTIYLIVIAGLILLSAQMFAHTKAQPLRSSEAGQVKVFYNKQTEANRLVIETIQDADQFVYFAIYTFTRADIKDALLGAKYRGLDVRGVIDKKQTAEITEQRKIVQELIQYQIPIYFQDHDSIMHLKTLVTEKTYLSGSYNWTASGTTRNDEVIELGQHEPIREQYQRVLEELFRRYNPDATWYNLIMEPADIFFIIGTIAIILITALAAFALINLILFLLAVKRVAKSAQRATELVSEDLKILGQAIKEKGFTVKSFLSFLKNIKNKKWPTLKKLR